MDSVSLAVVLRVLHKLNVISGIPIDINVFYEYAVYGMFDRVRLTACEILVEQIESKNDGKLMDNRLVFFSSNETGCIRLYVQFD